MIFEHVKLVLNNELYDLEDFKELLVSGRWAAYKSLNETQVAERLTVTEDRIKQVETVLEMIDEK